jgi:hypothetical protein
MMLKIFREFRLVTVALLIFMCSMAWDVKVWYTSLPNPTDGQAGFASAVILAIVGVGKYWMETKAAEHKDQRDDT